jgi:hypothetical protein
VSHGDDTENIREELRRLQPVIEEITGMSSRWTGRVDLVSNARFRGLKPFRCDILLDAALVEQPTRWRTLIHELLHSVSAGLNQSDYNAYQGWEEGTVEALQHCIRQEVLSRIGVVIEEEVLLLGDSAHPFNHYIAALENIRGILRQDKEFFYLNLLRTPIRHRYSFLVQQCLQLQGTANREAIRILSASRPILED